MSWCHSNIYVRLTLPSVFGRLWIPWHEGEPSVAQMRWMVAPPGHPMPLRGVLLPRVSPHSAPSPASDPGTTASPSVKGSLLPAWASELHPTCWGWVGKTSVCVIMYSRQERDGYLLIICIRKVFSILIPPPQLLLLFTIVLILIQFLKTDHFTKSKAQIRTELSYAFDLIGRINMDAKGKY